MSEFHKVRAKSHTFRIWIAGNVADAERECRRHTMSGLCVAVTKANYIYTMGAESGVCVTLINYPRFPLSHQEMKEKAVGLGHALCESLFQGSFSIEGPSETIWFSRKNKGAKS